MIINLNKHSTSKNKPPVFTYTGQYDFIQENKTDWRIVFKTSGVLEFTKLNNAKVVDVFCVGGGGGGTQRRSSVGDYGAGGGGGYTKTVTNISAQKNTRYSIVVGNGGKAKYNSASGNPGGNSSALGVVAQGGGAQTYPSNGANGGSGGGGTYLGDADGYFWHSGGEDGSDGASGRHIKNPGIGQHTTTREFGDPNAKAYSRGGPTTSGEVYTRDPNTGDGGYGGQREATDGASGIVIIRNHRP